jgi:molybdopterin molybdotransferase
MAGAPASPGILSFEAARHLVEQHAKSLGPRGEELVDLLECAGCVLAEPVTADRDFPPFPRATRDGYAVRAADLCQLPARLDVIGEIKAGSMAGMRVESGQAVSIMTGAGAPQGADAVVMVEYTAREGSRVTVHKGLDAGDNIVPVGAEAKRGERLLTSGMRLDYAAIALAASVGRSRLLVHSRPRIAVLSTGDELVDIDVPPGPTQIRNSNSYSLAAQIQLAGGEPVLLPIAPDSPARLHQLISKGSEADLLLLTGGVSAGKYDLVEAALAEFGAEFFFTGAQVQPGRPVVFGRLRCDASKVARETASAAPRHKYFLGLPGNPVSTMVTFELFARPVVEALAGMLPRRLVFLHAKLGLEIKIRTGLRRFLPAVLSGELEQAEVQLVDWQGSGDIAATARANCYVVIAPDRERIPAGEWVPVLMR